MKKTYEVYGHCNLICCMTVSAENLDEAIEIANEEFGGLTNYAGNGGIDRLVGTLACEDNRSIYVDTDPEFDDGREIMEGESI